MALCNDPRIRTLLCVLRGSEAHFLWVIHWGISHQWRCLSPSCWLLKKACAAQIEPENGASCAHPVKLTSLGFLGLHVDWCWLLLFVSVWKLILEISWILLFAGVVAAAAAAAAVVGASGSVDCWLLVIFCQAFLVVPQLLGFVQTWAGNRCDDKIDSNLFHSVPNPGCKSDFMLHLKIFISRQSADTRWMKQGGPRSFGNSQYFFYFFLRPGAAELLVVRRFSEKHSQQPFVCDCGWPTSSPGICIFDPTILPGEIHQPVTRDDLQLWRWRSATEWPGDGWSLRRRDEFSRAQGQPFTGQEQFPTKAFTQSDAQGQSKGGTKSCA